MDFPSTSALLLVVFSGCVLSQQAATAAEPTPVKVEFRRAESKPADGLTEATVVGSDKKVYLHKDVEITNKDIDEAKPGLSIDGEPEVVVRFTKQGAEKMAKMSEAHRGKLLAILVDGKVVCAPLVRDVITRYAKISGSFTHEEVERIANGITAK